MNDKMFDRLILISTGVLVLSGAVTLLFPIWLVSLYGVRLTAGGAVLARSFGAAYLGLGVISWYVLHQGSADLYRALSTGLGLCFGLGFVIFFISQLSGVFNSLGWFDVVLNGLLMAWHGIYLISARE